MKKIVTLSETNYLRALEIAEEYKYIELRLAKLKLSILQIKQIINASEKTIITDFLSSSNPFICNILTNEKIIIDIPFDFLADNKNNFDIFSDCQILVSYHFWNNFTELLNDNKIYSIIEKMIEASNVLKINYFKIAVMINNEEEEEKFFSLFEKYSELKGKLILIPLGKKFQQSRIKSLELGSPFMYCYVDTPATDCQLHFSNYL